jgi:hypothetical protein
MLELLLLFGVVAYLVSKAPLGAENAAPGAPPRATDAGAPLQLSIADTQRPLLPAGGFVRTFGLDPREVRDLRMYARPGPLESFPLAVVAVLLEVYGAGRAIGAETMALIFNGRPLAPGEALYFVLVAARTESRVVAFIGNRIY